jgi:tricorn protease
VIFASARTSAPQQSYLRLWSVSLDGGLPEALPMPRAFTGTFSPDGKRLAYEEIGTAFVRRRGRVHAGRRYQGS